MSNYFNYFYEWLKIDLKANNEYKANLYSHLALVFTDILITILNLIILKKNFDFFVLNETQILFFVLNMYFIYLLFGSSAMSKQLGYFLLKGKLNNFLLRPRNVFLQYNIRTIRTRRLISASIILLFLIGYVFYFKISFFKFLISLWFSLIGGSLYLVITCFFDSLAFFMKKGNFILDIFISMNDTFKYYPYSFLENFTYSKLLLLFPCIFFGSIVTEYLFGFRSFGEMLNFSFLMLGFLILFSLGTFFLWKIGLKRYEGYN